MKVISHESEGIKTRLVGLSSISWAVWANIGLERETPIPSELDQSEYQIIFCEAESVLTNATYVARSPHRRERQCPETKLFLRDEMV